MAAADAILTAVLVILALIALHPFVTYPLSLRLLARRARPRPPVAPAGRPSLDVCLSLYNEELVAEEKIESLLRQAELYGPATINVYADGCSDGTVAILRRFEDRVRLVVSDSRQGKTVGMNTLIAGVGGELLLFTDANVRAPDTALVDLAAPFADRGVGCVTARLAYTNPAETPTSGLGARYWAIEERIKSLEDAVGNLIGVDGAMFAIRRSLYRTPPPDLIDDLYVSLFVLIQRARVTQVAAVEVRERSATLSAEEYGRKARIACQAMNVHKALWPQLRTLPPTLVYCYLSHRFMRWMTPFVLALAAPCGLILAARLAGAPATGVAVSIAALLIGLGQALGLRASGFVVSAAMSLVGVARGVVESLVTRKTYTVWEPASSVRDHSALPDIVRD